VEGGEKRGVGIGRGGRRREGEGGGGKEGGEVIEG